MTDIASLSIGFSSDTCKIWLLRSVRECPRNNWLRETMGARVFIGFPTTDILNWSDVASSSSTTCIKKKTKKKVSIATRKIVDHLGILHLCGGTPSHMLVWPDYGDNCQKCYYLAANKVSYGLFSYLFR